jgi:signal transduction histidine kinase
MAGLPSSTARPRRRAATLVLPALILLAGIVAHAALVEAGDRTERERLDRHADRVAATIARRVRTYGEVLYSVHGLFLSSRHVTPREFHDNLAAQRIFRRHPGVQVVGFAQWAEGTEIPELAARVGRETAASGLGYPRFRVQPDPGGSPQAPIVYFEPRAGNAKAFGFDFMSEAHRRGALLRTLTSGRPEATAPVRLVQERGRQRGFLVMLGVKRPDGRPRGAAYAAFRMGDLVRGAIGTRGRDEIEIYDRGVAGGDVKPLAAAKRAFDSDGTAEAGLGGAAYGSRLVDVEVMGRAWTIHVAPRAGMATRMETTLEWLAFALGALLAAVAAWLLGSAQRTERRALALAERMTEHLRTSQTELARSNAELERFAYVASHDLREPLRTVTGFLGLLSRRHRDRLDDEGQEFVELAVAGAKRMDALIAELLEYSRAGRGESRADAVDVEAAWNVAVRNLGAAIAESGAEVTAGPLPVVLADRGEMVQLLQNLVSNAIKYRGEHPPRIHIDAVPHGDEWEIAVADDGPGIDPRHHERIFVLLHRLHRRDEVEGTGIGLAICKKIIERHGGRIWVESAEGQGARFAFTLPAATVPATDAPAPLAPAAA